MIENIFKKFAIDYQTLLNDLYATLESRKEPIFRKEKIKYTEFQHTIISNLKNDYNYISSIKGDSRSIDDWLLLVKLFAHFVSMAEKVYFFNNIDSEDKNVSVSIDKYSNRIQIDFSPDNLDINIHISFQESAINMPGKVTSLLSDFLPKDEYHSDMVTFVDIKSEKIHSGEIEEFKFVLDSNIAYETKEHELLLDNIRHIVSMMIFDCFFDIINNHIIKVTYMNGNTIKVEEILKDELYFRRYERSYR